MRGSFDAFKSQKLTYLNLAALHDLQAAVRDAEETSRPGALVECGCALGGSAIVLAAARKGNDRPVWVYDVFGMIPPPSDRDGEDVKERYSTIVSGEAKGLDGQTYYGYKQSLYDEVTASFKRFGLPVETGNIHLIKGLFEDTLRPGGAVALAHLDGDWYDSLMVCLERLWPMRWILESSLLTTIMPGQVVAKPSMILRLCILIADGKKSRDCIS